MSIIIGINAYHGDAAACIVKNGRLLAAVEEERFRRIKHWAGFPEEAIRYCLLIAGVKLADVDVIAINSDPKANLGRKAIHALRYQSSPRLIIDRVRNRSARESVEAELKARFPDSEFTGRVDRVEHHLAHLSSAFHVSPYEEAALLSVDGFGDFASGAWGVGKGAEINVDGRVHYPHSLGAFYQAMTQFIGFPNYGDEYKVMGLAPYGEPKFLEELREIVRLRPDGNYELDLKYFRFHKEKVAYEWESGSPHVGNLYSDALSELLGAPRESDQKLTQLHKDIAASTQAMFEEAMWHKLRWLHSETGQRNLCLAGGCGNNSVANGKIVRNTEFEGVYVPASSGDAGGAIGAAYCSYYKDNPRNVEQSHMRHAYLGPESTDDEIAELVRKNQQRLDEEKCEWTVCEDEDSFLSDIAAEIADGAVIGWFQGRMEWGPRALGNRSILGDVRRAEMKEILNLKIKRRESFRPFAPSILRERVSEWFEQEDDVPFMMKVFQFREEKRGRVPAVAHVDGSGRLQTVVENDNPRYHRLIRKFEDLTGVPIILNTSFNENEPVVCLPEEALNCFLRTKMDVLVLNNHVIKRLDRLSLA